MHYSQAKNSKYSYKELMRLSGIAVFLIAIIINSLPALGASITSAKAPVSNEAAKAIITADFTKNTRVMLFSARDEEWVISAFGDAKPGSEFYFNNHLYRAVDSNKAQLIPNVDAGKLFEADRQYDESSRRPKVSDVVQVLDKNSQFLLHAVLGAVQPGVKIRFQGRVYCVKSNCSLVNTGIVFSSETNALQRIEITRSSWQHITDRHTEAGTMTAGKSIFYPDEDIKALIKNAQLQIAVMESNGLYKRVFDAGRNIGYDVYRGRETDTSTYLVITMGSGKLVTAYPVVQ